MEYLTLKNIAVCSVITLTLKMEKLCHRKAKYLPKAIEPYGTGT